MEHGITRTGLRSVFHQCSICGPDGLIRGLSGSGLSRPDLLTVIARMQPAVCFFDETRSSVATRRSGDRFSIAVMQKRIAWSRAPALPAPVQASVERLDDGPSIFSPSLMYQLRLSSPQRIASVCFSPP